MHVPLMKKFAPVLATAVAFGALLTGCGTAPSESPAERGARLEPIVMAVPGVTGGSLKVANAGVTNIYDCQLTSDASDREALKAVLTDVLRTLAAEANDSELSTVSNGLSNGTEKVTSEDLGLNNPVYIRDIREKLG